MCIPIPIFMLGLEIGLIKFLLMALICASVHLLLLNRGGFPQIPLPLYPSKSYYKFRAGIAYNQE